MYMKIRRENAGVDVNTALKAAQTKYEYASAAGSPAGMIQYGFKQMLNGKAMTTAQANAYMKKNQQEAADWNAVINGMQGISGWGGGTKGTRTGKTTGKG
jgi:hypothetical protein